MVRLTDIVRRCSLAVERRARENVETELAHDGFVHAAFWVVTHFEYKPRLFTLKPEPSFWYRLIRHLVFMLCSDFGQRPTVETFPLHAVAARLQIIIRLGNRFRNWFRFWFGFEAMIERRDPELHELTAACDHGALRGSHSSFQKIRIIQWLITVHMPSAAKVSKPVLGTTRKIQAL